MTTLAPPAGLGGSPVAARVEVVSCDGPRSVTRCTVEATEPVLPGHYPGFPIFPGVCLVECADRSARLTVPGGPAGAPLELIGIDSARFTGPVFPGDVLTIELDWRTDAGDLRCRAKLRTARGGAAQVRLRYRTGEGPAA
jgi:3-hydroxyacyl-[acyl-carrier-protein] dehydratase